MTALDTRKELCQMQNHWQGGGDNHIPCASHSDAWFCVQTVPQAEIRAFTELNQAGFKAYLPRYVLRRQRYGKPETLIRPLFPSYLFVSFDPEQDAWGLIYRTRGVRQLFTTPSGSPAPMRRGEITRLMALGRAGDGVIDDEATPFPTILPGQSVTITSGPFANWTGVCKWSEGQRIGVLMTLFAAERVVPMMREVVVPTA